MSLDSILILFILFVLSMLLLFKGADFLVEGSSETAKRFNVPSLIIGLTIVSFGTSLPEFVISLIAVLTGASGISVGNIIGSNIANIGLILGISAIIYPLPVKSTILRYEMPFLIVSVISYFILANDLFIFDQENLMIQKRDGFFFSSFYSFFFIIFFIAQKKEVMS